MSNALIGELDITVNEKSYTLRPTFEGLIEIEKRANCSLAQLTNRILLGIAGITDVTAIIYGGIYGHSEGKPPITHGDIGQQIMKHGYCNLLGECGQFVAASISGTDINECAKTEVKKNEDQTPTTLK